MLLYYLKAKKVPYLNFRRFLAESIERGNVTERKEWTIKQKEIESKIPVEKRSVSRGLALNRFEKDFLIYPEYSDMDDSDKIKERVKKLDSELRAALLVENMDKTGALSSSVMSTLLENNIYGISIPSVFEGENLCYKDLICIHEVIGQDLSIFLSLYTVQLAANIILTYGSDNQKAKYLPKIASFQCKPAICMIDDLEHETIASFTSSVVKGELNGIKNNVINGKNANLFLIHAKNKYLQIESLSYGWYLIDLSEIGNGKVNIVDRHETNGLKALHVSKVKFSNIAINNSQQLTSDESNEEISSDIFLGDQLFHGSAVCGFAKRLLNDIIEYANRKVERNHRLGESIVVQKSIAELALNVFALESIVYYLAGLLDEKILLATDIENSIIARHVHRTLRQALLTVIDTVGILSTEQGFPYEQKVRDLTTYLSLYPPEFVHVKNIAAFTIESWLDNTQHKNAMYKPNIVKKLIFGNNILKDPKLKHYIAEHVHPSLSDSCTKLEQTMFKFNIALRNICDFHGTRIMKEAETSWNIATLVDNNFSMMACIDLTLSMSNRKTEFGRIILEEGGYCLETPIEKNW